MRIRFKKDTYFYEPKNAEFIVAGTLGWRVGETMLKLKIGQGFFVPCVGECDDIRRTVQRVADMMVISVKTAHVKRDGLVGLRVTRTA